MKALSLTLLLGSFAMAAEWSKPVEIVVDDTVCASYRARVDTAGNLLIQLTLADGWHTFAMDNQIRANEKLAGKKALGMDRPTQFTLTGGLAVAGPWMQPEVTDFSKPELRIFSWGFTKQALFAAPVKRTGTGRIAIKAQACTESICKNIDAALELTGALPSAPTDLALTALTPVRVQ